MSQLIFLREGIEKSSCCSCGNQISTNKPSYRNLVHDIAFCMLCGKEAMKDIWYLKGMQNPWIRVANDPPFTRSSSFYECSSIDELIEKFSQGNWCVGNAFTFENLALIQQVDGGNEYLAILDHVVFDSISFQAILRKRGEEYTRNYINNILHQPLDCQSPDPDYSIVELFV
ncbi:MULTISPECIES: hypothetical protein [unclassified Paenibacillus]|uniref:hypothetical protein n=1 Tax=unclassified Paenibacillus TaxID=185978 RepID=UPI00278A3A7C|nr:MULTISPECIES: hypothetical protein [unclassified Paenibacillus]MDQ0896353.1 hypothetical protein [Paenibacillus sp. V4I7]MDQ0914104.1 hypothetical protein [Paenibacillus sp. V4I5]